jgi:hydantoinase/carbamoylase family amidase
MTTTDETLGADVPATGPHAGLHAAIAHLATFNSDPAAGGITREVYTPLYEASLEYVSSLMADAGLEVRVDAAGNLVGRWEGSDPSAPAVLTGSHFDTTLNAGAYDGVVGVLGAIEAVRALRHGGARPRRPIEVIGFAGEEPRFVAGCIGSRAMVGELSRAQLDELVDRDGITAAAALRSVGLDPDAVGEAVIDFAAVHAFVELHIEQGGVLEAAGESIGIVTSIAAPHELRMRLHGVATHAGGTPMTLRHDALVGAAEIIVELERLAAGSSSGTTVGTVGVIRALPGAINVVPGEVEIEVDVRDSDGDVRRSVVDALLAFASALCERRGLRLELETIAEDHPAQCSDLVIDATAAACADLGLSSRRMISGAYHDAMVLGSHVPIGMIFVPSAGGISHHPDEYTSPAEIDAGVDVLAGVLARLAEA